MNRLLISCIALLLLSCERAFDNNEDFKQNQPVEVFGDNNLLFSKIFQFAGGNNGAYLWFDIRNEIANFSSPFLGQSFTDTDVARYKRIDLRGRLYRYDSKLEELTILGYPLDIITGEEIPADIVYSFARKQKEGCELITDANQRRTCERTFVLQVKKMLFPSIDLTLNVNEKGVYGTRTFTLSDMAQELLLTN